MKTTPPPLPALALALFTAFAAPAFAAKEAPKETKEVKLEPRKDKGANVTTVEGAIALAKAENKLVFIVLGREACENCQALKKSIRTREFRFSNKYEWVEVSCDNAEELAAFRKHFKTEGKILPFVAITDGAGNDLAHAGGPLTRQQFEELLESARRAANKAKLKKG